MSNVLPKIFHGRGYTNDMKAHEKVFNILSHEGSENLNQWDITTHLSEWLKQKIMRTSLSVQWLTLCASNARSTGSAPVQGTKIPYAVQCGQKKTKSDTIKCWRGCRAWITQTLLVGTQNGTSTLENTPALSYKTKHRTTLWSSSCTHGPWPPEKKKLCSHKHCNILKADQFQSQI